MFEIAWEGLEELIDEAMAMHDSVRKITVQNLENLGQYARYLCRVELDDVRYTGALERSFVIETDKANMRVKVFPTASHRMYVRMGTRPHWSPIGPLKRWAAAKLGDEKLAYPVQRSIARHGTSVWQERKRGTKANPWPERVVRRTDFQNALKKTARETGVQIIAEFAI